MCNNDFWVSININQLLTSSQKVQSILINISINNNSKFLTINKFNIIEFVLKKQSITSIIVSIKNIQSINIDT